MRLDGKVAIVTGAASGIGKRIAEVYAENGAAVAIADINLDAANTTAQELATKGAKAIGVKMDVTDEQAVDDGVAAVLKQFGAPVSPGMLSFPQPGVTLALDFPNVGPRLHALFATLDRIVQDAGGRLYPAKDGRMTAASFQAGYPRWQAFTSYIDPRFSSGFWRRVSESS